MTEPTISGKPEVLGWDSRVGGPRLEIPLSIPVDSVWMEAQAQAQANFPVGMSMKVDSRGTDEAGRLIVSFGWPPRNTTQGEIRMRGGAQETWSVADALEAIEDHLADVGRRAGELRKKIRAVESELDEWESPQA